LENEHAKGGKEAHYQKKKKNFLQHFEEERRNRDLNERRKFQVFNIKTI
jgi:hypothetical protein